MKKSNYKSKYFQKLSILNDLLEFEENFIFNNRQNINLL